jgi:hypothetical protein
MTPDRDTEVSVAWIENSALPTGRSQGRVGEILSAVVVDDDSNGQIGGSNDGLTDVERPVVELWLPHLANDVEECWSARIGD